MPCAAPCDWVPCSKRCAKVLSCGHQCPSICGTECPGEAYCQVCAPGTIKGLRVDSFEMSTYAEIDLSANPCIFLPCGHVFTVETLDGEMAMSDHYELDGDSGMPIAVKNTSKAYSYKEVKACPDCRGPLCLIPRYGRIVRRALLDESTKKLITWSNQAYLEFAEEMRTLQGKLIKTKSGVILPTVSIAMTDGNSHVQMLSNLSGMSGRYRSLSVLRGKINLFLQQTSEAAQPFARVHNIVETVRRRRLEDGDRIKAFDFDQDLTQTRGPILGTALAIRCELIAIADYFGLLYGQQQQLHVALQVDFSPDRSLCMALVELATKTRNILQQAEGLIFWAHFAGLECEMMESRDGIDNALLEEIKTEADAHLDEAKVLCEKFPGQTNSVVNEVDDVRRLLHEAGYQSQMRMVVAAMQGEFSGTSHWYRCENGHPFTVGECGMPMQTARCPQCDAPIGGANHQSAAGVQAAADIERDFGNMTIGQ